PGSTSAAPPRRLRRCGVPPKIVTYRIEPRRHVVDRVGRVLPPHDSRATGQPQASCHPLPEEGSPLSSDAPTPGSAEMTPVPAPPERTGADTAAAGPVTWTPGVRWRSGRVALGGSPWSVTVVPEGMRAFAERARATAPDNVTAEADSERAAARFLLDR